MVTPPVVASVVETFFSGDAELLVSSHADTDSASPIASNVAVNAFVMPCPRLSACRNCPAHRTRADTHRNAGFLSLP